METRWSVLGKVTASQSEDGEEYASGRDGTRDAGCVYTTLRKTICSLEKDASGKPTQKCEKTEQVLRKCAGRPAEVVDSKVETTEEDASTSHRFSLDYDSSAGSRYATPFQWHQRRFGPGGDAVKEEYPLRGLFERNEPAIPGSLEELVQNVFDDPFDVSTEGKRAAPPTTAPGSAEHLFGWFKRGPSGGESRLSPPADASASDQSKSNQEVARLYEALARGVQEV